jgi:4-hydroxythreonine-4-phosphate dehydrogenase
MATPAGGPPLALTRGDPSGIGLEITLKAWLATHASAAAEPFILVADPALCERVARAQNLDVPIATTTPREAAGLFARALPVLALDVETHGAPGRPDVQDAAGTIASMERCVELVGKGEASAVVTNPVSKEILRRAGFRHPGQTEFMGEMAERLWGFSGRAVMLLWSPALAVVPATIHVPIASVPALVTAELIVDTVRIVAYDYAARFGVARPRIAVTGLNPHAGEGGDMGREEIDTIAPALARLAAEGYAVTGPHPADTLFHAAARERYDVVVTMYHDQALIPIKTLAFDTAVNVTLGLPFVRASPDHGTAYDIAGLGVADPSSLVAALHLAARIARADRGPRDPSEGSAAAACPAA